MTQNPRVWWEIWVRAALGNRTWMLLPYRSVDVAPNVALPDHVAPTSRDAHAFARKQMRRKDCIKVVRVTRRSVVATKP